MRGCGACCLGNSTPPSYLRPFGRVETVRPDVQTNLVGLCPPFSQRLRLLARMRQSVAGLRTHRRGARITPWASPAASWTAENARARVRARQGRGFLVRWILIG